MNKTLAQAKKFAQDHKVAIAVVATLTVCVVFDRTRVNAWNNFLKEHDLFEKFYSED